MASAPGAACVRIWQITLEGWRPPGRRALRAHVLMLTILFITDGYGNARVHKFAADGTHLLSWGEPGSAPGQFMLPHGVWIDRSGRVLVCDREKDRVQVFDLAGTLMSIWATSSSAPRSSTSTRTTSSTSPSTTAAWSTSSRLAASASRIGATRVSVRATVSGATRAAICTWCGRCSREPVRGGAAW